MKRQLYFFLFLLPTLLLGQERRLNLDVLTGVPSGNIYLSYEQVYDWKANQSLGFRVGVGWANTYGVEGVYYLGKKHQLELSPGFFLGTNFFPVNVPEFPELSYGSFSYLQRTVMLRVGYVWNPTDKFSLRAGFSPAYRIKGKKSNPLVPFLWLTPYLGVSYRF